MEEFGLWIPPRAKKLWKNKTGTLFSLNWIPLWGFVKIAGESEIFLEYFDNKGKKLSLWDIQKKLQKDKKIFDSAGKEISDAEKKYLHEHLKSYKPGENFYEKNIFQKTAVLLAGVVMNFLLAGVIFSVLFMVWVKPIGVNTIIPTKTHSKLIPTLDDALESWLLEEKKWIILYPVKDSLAEKAGIQEADILMEINGKEITDIQKLQKLISESKNTPLTLTLKSWCEKNIACSNKKTKEVILTPSNEGKVWSYLAPNIVPNKDFKHKYSALDSIKYGFQEMYVQSKLTLSWLKMLLKKIIIPEKKEDRKEALNQVAGPIGIVSVITQSLAGWVSLLLILAAIISVNLGVFNLLPIPALDGGRILLLWIRTTIEVFFGKTSIAGKIENFTHVSFFLLLIALSILIAYNDIVKIFQT